MSAENIANALVSVAGRFFPDRSTVLRGRIAELEAARTRLAGMSPQDQMEKDRKDRLLRYVDSAEYVCCRELAVREKLDPLKAERNRLVVELGVRRIQSAAAVTELNAFKLALFAKQQVARLTQRDLDAADRQRYAQLVRSRDASRAAAERVERELQAARKQVEEAGKDLPAILDQYPAFPGLDSKAGEVCMPCVKAGVDVLDYNIAMLNKKDVSAQFFSGRQSNKDTCALMSTNSVDWQATGNRIPAVPTLSENARRLDQAANLDAGTPANEQAMVSIGHQSGGYLWCSGTTNEAAVMTEAGIPADLTNSPSLEDIARAVEEGRGVVVGYDARPVWNQMNDPQPAGHAVRVTAVTRNEKGEITRLFINDSGDGQAGRELDAATFQQALDGRGGGRMAVSRDVLFPAVERPESLRQR